MKSRRLLAWRRTITLLLLTVAALVVGSRSSAQELQQHAPGHNRYALVDLGTFGGPQSYLNYARVNSPSKVLTNQGVVAGWADTPTPDPFPSLCFNPDCFVSHAFQWENGVLTDLGALAPGWSSAALWISETGLVVGLSQNGVIDPLTGIPETRAVLWEDGHIIDLGTLGGNTSAAFAVNDAGQVVGFSANSTPDPFPLGPTATQTRAFLWQRGVMYDLGTLGGPDAFAMAINERGEVAGFSYTSFTPGPNGIPQIDPFLWDDRKMIDLGSLGGPTGFPMALNNRGQVVGVMDTAGGSYKGFQLFHPFLWDHGQLIDLGSFNPALGFGQAWGINDQEKITGWMDNLVFDFPFLWRHGVKENLGDVAGDTCAYGLNINSRGQIVGESNSCDVGRDIRFTHAFLWEDGGPVLDLNTRLASVNGTHVTSAVFINDRSEIASLGVLSSGEQHAFLLVPCGDGDGDCSGSVVDSTLVTQRNTRGPSNATPTASGIRQRGMLDRLHDRRSLTRRTLGQGSVPH
jgi:probable HAF family extracellular repeat protein